MNVFKLVFELHDELEAEYRLLTKQADLLNTLDNDHAKAHAFILMDKCEKIVNNLVLLDKFLKTLNRRNDRAGEATTFSDLIEQYQNNPALMEHEGREWELQKLAADKWTDSVGYELHQYGDGTVEPVIFNHESLKRMEDKEQSARRP